MFIEIVLMPLHLGALPREERDGTLDLYNTMQYIIKYETRWSIV